MSYSEPKGKKRVAMFAFCKNSKKVALRVTFFMFEQLLENTHFFKYWFKFFFNLFWAIYKIILFHNHAFNCRIPSVVSRSRSF